MPAAAEKPAAEKRLALRLDNELFKALEDSRKKRNASQQGASFTLSDEIRILLWKAIKLETKQSEQTEHTHKKTKR
jgi:hypothetical protein